MIHLSETIARRATKEEKDRLCKGVSVTLVRKEGNYQQFPFSLLSCKLSKLPGLINVEVHAISQ